ncbi:hypothetical protein TNCV_4393391 [Trichonephila clavipes]|nr:hypothetical protein TNCV_4393391 [Trichonephila clavipes]
MVLSTRDMRKGNVGSSNTVTTEENIAEVQELTQQDRGLIVTCLFSWTATTGSDVVQSGRPIFDDFFQHLWPYIGNNTANVVFQMVKRLWLIRMDQNFT